MELGNPTKPILKKKSKIKDIYSDWLETEYEHKIEIKMIYYVCNCFQVPKAEA